MKNIFKKIIPQPMLNFYHWFLARVAAIWYGNPSEKMIIIGVTGTAGKTTTVNLIAHILDAAGFKTGFTSTAEFKVGDKRWLNDKKMTMLGRFQTQALLRDMVRAGCQYAIVETSSQGIEQYRHIGIHYDAVVLTNLYPEHIEAHGSFANYKKAKLKLFYHFENGENKVLRSGSGDLNKVPKSLVVNFDPACLQDTRRAVCEYDALEFLGFVADKKYVFGVGNKMDLTGTQELLAQGVQIGEGNIKFNLNSVAFDMPLWGEYNAYNALAAIGVGLACGLTLEQMAKLLHDKIVLPGKMEEISEGQPFRVIIDYAFEPVALKNVYNLLQMYSKKRLISVLGSCGGGRDVSRRPIMGELAAQYADVIIVTNEDPYDDDPRKIVDQVAASAMETQKHENTKTPQLSEACAEQEYIHKSKIVEGENLFKVLDRREAIAKAFSLAQPGDIVLITGKGCEQAMAVKGKLISWDDRQVAREELGKISKA